MDENKCEQKDISRTKRCNYSLIKGSIKNCFTRKDIWKVFRVKCSKKCIWIARCRHSPSSLVVSASSSSASSSMRQPRYDPILLRSWILHTKPPCSIVYLIYLEICQFWFTKICYKVYKERPNYNSSSAKPVPNYFY